MMKKTNNDLLKFHNSLTKNLEKLEKDSEFMTNFYSNFKAGQSELYQKEISETKKFDEEWIETVESYFPSINKIVLNPRSSVKLEEEISPIEKARKINSQSIKHLSANTHMLKEVRTDGTVVPQRILTSYAEIDYELYENRFIMTLIDRLFIFVRSRYDIIKTNVESHDKRQVKIKSTFPVNDTVVDFNLDVTIIDEIENKEINIYNKMLLKRVEELNKLVTSLKTSQFMELMKNAKKIHPPIMKTNVIMKDVSYHNAYLLWLFLDRYNTLAYSLDILEKDLDFNDPYLLDINRQVLSTFSTITANHYKNTEKYEKIEPKEEAYESIKFVTKNAEDIKYEPKDLVIEDNTINEYYLEMNKKIFEKSLDYHQENTKTDETALKRALRDTLKISNALYNSYFGLDEETDIFKQLITEVNVAEELDNTKHKIFIAKMIREVKEVDYNKTLRLERKLLLELKNFDSLLRKDQVKKLASRKSQLAFEKKTEAKAKLIEARRTALLEELNNVKEKRDEINKLRTETTRAINAYQILLNKQLEDEINDLSKDYDKQLANKLKRLDDELEAHRRINEQKLINIEKVEDEKLVQQLAEIDSNFENEMNKVMSALKAKHKREVDLAVAEMQTKRRLEQARFKKSLESNEMRIRGKRQARRVANRKVLVQAQKDLIKKHEEKLAEIRK